MQKDHLDNKINLNLLITTNGKENFEKDFSLIFRTYNNIEEDEEFEDKIYFHKNILLYQTENSSYHFQAKNNDKFEKKAKKLNEELSDAKEGIETIDKLKKELISDNDKVISKDSFIKENQIVNDNNLIKEEKIGNFNNNQKSKSKGKKIIKKDTSNISTKTRIRGPYKKKPHAIIKANLDDKCFPFTSGKGLINSFKGNSSKLNKDNSIQSEKENIKNSNSKLRTNAFKINRYDKDSEGKMKKIKKPRKFKSDDIRKKIKSNCHKIIKNIINENLKNAGSEELFGFLPQSFLGNVSKIFNKRYMNSTYEDLLSIDFSKNEKSFNLEIDKKNYNKNVNVLNYLEKNPEISKISGFYRIKNMKYKDILNSYFLSNEFENTIDMLKNKNETSEYISEYIFLAKKYINYFSN